MNFISTIKGNFRRIFPPEDKTRMEKYNGLLADAFKLFLSGKKCNIFFWSNMFAGIGHSSNNSLAHSRYLVLFQVRAARKATPTTVLSSPAGAGQIRVFVCFKATSEVICFTLMASPAISKFK